MSVSVCDPVAAGGSGSDWLSGGPLVDLVAGLSGGPDTDVSELILDLGRCLSRVAGEPQCGGLTAAGAREGDVTALTRVVNAVTCETARRLIAALRADVLTFGARTVLQAAGLAPGSAARLLTAARFADAHQVLARLWRTGAIGADTITAIARGCRRLSVSETDAVIAALLDRLPDIRYRDLVGVVARMVAVIKPEQTDTTEQDDYDARFVAFSNFNGNVSFTGQLPAVEGELFQNAVTACAEALRTEGDCLTPGQRLADGLTELVARATGERTSPNLGGTPVAATMTFTAEEAERVATGQPRSHTPPGYTGTGAVLGAAAARFALCAGAITPVLTDRGGSVCGCGGCGCDPPPGSLLRRIADTRQLPLALGQTVRLATPAQRKALALRDQGCVINGCQIPAERCQPHHVRPYSLGGKTDLENLASLCWVHHRQVELNHFTITRTQPRGGSGRGGGSAGGGNPPYWTVTPTKPWQRTRQ